METQPSKSGKNFRQIFFNLFPVPVLAGIILGAVGGWIYYIEIGCSTGTCPLTSNPYMSIIWGAVIGYLVGDLFRKKKPVESESKNDQSS